MKSTYVALAAALAFAGPLYADGTSAIPLVAKGPEGALAGTLLEGEPNDPLVLILPGSGPTDQDGNNPLGVTASSYRLLAEALATQGIASLRIDKRGIGGSRAASSNPNMVTLADYVADGNAWIDAVQRHSPARTCIWLLGHSEGGLIALLTAQDNARVCGVMLVAAPGRKMGDIMREQFRANPANAPVLDDALRALDGLEAGRKVDVSAMHPALQQFFHPSVQGYLIDLLAADPAMLVASLNKPLVVVQGGRDIQVRLSDAQALVAAKPGAQLLVVPQMTHTLKDAIDDSAAANMATYSDASLPVNPDFVAAIVALVRKSVVALPDPG